MTLLRTLGIFGIVFAFAFACAHSPTKNTDVEIAPQRAGSGSADHAEPRPESSSSLGGAPSLPAAVFAPSVASEAPTFEGQSARVRAAGFGAAADVIELRVRQERRKMKLERDEGLRALAAVSEELPSMPQARALLSVMPKSTVELVRSVRERGVDRAEAERMAEYLFRLREALRLENPAPFDENCSHVIGREWREIDYRDEGMTWENQERVYARHGVAHFRDAANLERFFRVESKAPYFQKLYRPQGSVP